MASSLLILIRADLRTASCLLIMDSRQSVKYF